MKERILLHICCAPCSVGCIRQIRESGMEPVGLWYNPNIHPYQEYLLRRDTLIEYAAAIDLELILRDEYGLRKFTEAVCGNVENRCGYCYALRLEEAARTAAARGLRAFTTTLTVSPYQNHPLIFEIGEKAAAKYGVTFLPWDFSSRYREGQAEARAWGMYLQKYCGCIYSEEARFQTTAPEKPLLCRPERPEPPRFEIRKISEKICSPLLAELADARPGATLNRADLYGLLISDEVVSLAALLCPEPRTLELAGLITKAEYRGMGYARKLLRHLFGSCGQKYDQIIVGAPGAALPFFIRQGFDRYEKTEILFPPGREETPGTPLLYYTKTLHPAPPAAKKQRK